jgi:hypothetical protein
MSPYDVCRQCDAKDLGPESLSASLKARGVRKVDETGWKIDAENSYLIEEKEDPGPIKAK